MSEVTLAQPSANANKLWDLFDIYRIGPTFPVKILNFASFTSDGYLDIYETLPTAARRRNLQGLVITCGLAVSLFYANLEKK